MIAIKLEKNKRNEPIFKLRVTEEDLKDKSFLKRALMEGTSLKGEYNYKVPIRFFLPIINKLDTKEYEIHKDSLDFFLEFSDDYDEKYYYRTEADARYMKRWREEGCPNIYKTIIDINNKKTYKEIAFKRLGNTFSSAFE